MDILFLAALNQTPLETAILVIQFIIIFLFSISFHEAAHAYMAYKCGDDTARLMGRMTLNPIAHIDPIGTILIPGIMIVSSFIGTNMPGLIGWAKPVPVNPLRFRRYHQGEILVSLAGPFSNLMLLAGGIIICKVLIFIGRATEIGESITPILMFFYFFASLNAALFIFNLIPIHPLDGSHILKVLLSRKAAEIYDNIITPYGFLLLIILVNTPVFNWMYELILNAMNWFILLGISY